MKKILIIAIGALVLLSGCTTAGLEAYQQAKEETGKIESGIMIIDVETDLVFNTEGLSDDEIMDLSYFDSIEFSSKNTYDMSTEDKQFISKIYYNLGGLGFDSIMYMNGNISYIQLPVLDGYYKMDDQNYSDYSQEDNLEYYTKVVLPIKDVWHEVLDNEDVIQGEKTYVISEEGQIKATTYSINAEEEQIKVLLDQVISVVKEENILGNLMSNQVVSIKDFDSEATLEKMKETLDRIELNRFEGKAYVDFDGRLIKEEFDLELSVTEPMSGELSSIAISYTIEYQNLGNEQDFDFPNVLEEDLKDIGEIDGEEFYFNQILN